MKILESTPVGTRMHRVEYNFYARLDTFDGSTLQKVAPFRSNVSNWVRFGYKLHDNGAQSSKNLKKY